MTERKLTETARNYQTGRTDPVPFPRYLCKASITEPGHTGTPRKHPCKLHIDHDGDHQCVCSRSWDPLPHDHEGVPA